MIERNDVELIAEMACRLDEMKNLFPEPAWRERLARAVDDMHEVAVQADAAHGFDLYLRGNE